MDSPAVNPAHPPRAPFVSQKGIYLDGTTVEVKMRNLEPSHDAAKGVFYTDLDGTRWTPFDGTRMTANGQLAGGPGWFEPLDDEEALSPDE